MASYGAERLKWGLAGVAQGRPDWVWYASALPTPSESGRRNEAGGCLGQRGRPSASLKLSFAASQRADASAGVMLPLHFLFGLGVA
jgi:hypothetical protein